MGKATKTTHRGLMKSKLDHLLRHSITEAVILVLIVISVSLLIIEAYGIASDRLLLTIEVIGDVITVFFIIELSLRWLVAPSTKQHFREYWLDWLSVLPFFRPVRALRGLRFLRALRILRLYRMGAIAQRFIAGTDTYWFEGKLRNEIATYHGRFADQIWLLPDIFRMLTNLLDDGRVNSESRRKICIALAYFITPFEVIPKAIHGPEGYLDQVYLCLKTIENLKEGISEMILDSAWDGEGEILEIISQELPFITENIGSEGIEQINRYLGLRDGF